MGKHNKITTRVDNEKESEHKTEWSQSLGDFLGKTYWDWFYNRHKIKTNHHKKHQKKN